MNLPTKKTPSTRKTARYFRGKRRLNRIYEFFEREDELIFGTAVTLFVVFEIGFMITGIAVSPYFLLGMLWPIAGFILVLLTTALFTYLEYRFTKVMGGPPQNYKHVDEDLMELNTKGNLLAERLLSARPYADDSYFVMTEQILQVRKKLDKLPSHISSEMISTLTTLAANLPTTREGIQAVQHNLDKMNDIAATYIQSENTRKYQESRLVGRSESDQINQLFEPISVDMIDPYIN